MFCRFLYMHKTLRFNNNEFENRSKKLEILQISKEFYRVMYAMNEEQILKIGDSNATKQAL